MSGTADRQPPVMPYNAKQKCFEQFYHRVFLLKIFVQFFMLFYTLPQLMPSRKQTSRNVIKIYTLQQADLPFRMYRGIL